MRKSKYLFGYFADRPIHKFSKKNVQEGYCFWTFPIYLAKEQKKEISGYVFQIGRSFGDNSFEYKIYKVIHLKSGREIYKLKKSGKAKKEKIINYLQRKLR